MTSSEKVNQQSDYERNPAGVSFFRSETYNFLTIKSSCRWERDRATRTSGEIPFASLFSNGYAPPVNTFYLAFGVGMQEMIVIFLIVLLLFGAKKIPELARGVGKGMGEFKKAKQEFEREIKMGEEEGKRDWDKPTSERDSNPKD